MQDSTVQLLNLVFSGVTAAGSLVAAAAAVTAIVHFWQHRRDDDVCLEAFTVDAAFNGETNRGGEFFTADIRITNIGRPTVTVVGLRFVGGFDEDGVQLDVSPTLCHELHQGAACEVMAIVTAEKDVALPGRAFLGCVTADGKVRGCAAVDFDKARAARNGA